jgi:hypothetical protein
MVPTSTSIVELSTTVLRLAFRKGALDCLVPIVNTVYHVDQRFRFVL